METIWKIPSSNTQVTIVYDVSRQWLVEIMRIEKELGQISKVLSAAAHLLVRRQIDQLQALQREAGQLKSRIAKHYQRIRMVLEPTEETDLNLENYQLGAALKGLRKQLDEWKLCLFQVKKNRRRLL